MQQQLGLVFPTILALGKILTFKYISIEKNIKAGQHFRVLNSRIISKENVSLKLTGKEIDLLIYLNNSQLECSSIDLQKNVWKQSGDLETHTVETHIYRLRKKIVDMFNDNNFILNTNNGYKISK